LYLKRFDRNEGLIRIVEEAIIKMITVDYQIDNLFMDKKRILFKEEKRFDKKIKNYNFT